MKSVSNILCVASCVLILGAMGAPAGAAITYDDFSTDPNLATEWTEYAYYSSDLVTTTWNSTDQDLDLTRPAGQSGIGLYRTVSSRSERPTRVLSSTPSAYRRSGTASATRPIGGVSITTSA